MGGKALGLELPRMNPVQYASAQAFFLNKLKELLPARRVSGLPHYKAKESFGDIDLLLEGPFTAKEWHSVIQALAPEIQVPCNSELHSSNLGVRFEGELLQLDLIEVLPENFDATLSYFSYNDLGKLCGLLFVAKGAYLGKSGLNVQCKHDGTLLGTIPLTQDWKVILELVGLDYSKWKSGFYDLNDMFEFVVSSPYFNKKYYLLEERSGKARRSDGKRRTYLAFLDWLSAKTDLPEYECLDGTDKWYSLAEKFPGVEAIHAKLVSEHLDSLKVSKLFNGGLVMAILGLNGPPLGKFIMQFKQQFGSETEFKQWALSQTEESMKTAIISFFNK